MDIRRVLIIALVIGVVLMLIKNPAPAAGLVKSALNGLEQAAVSIASFFRNIVN